jgi:hypothetical protein
MLEYCDYMAKVIHDSLKKDAHVYGSFVDSVGKVQWDLGPNGEFLSTKKTKKRGNTPQGMRHRE